MGHPKRPGIVHRLDKDTSGLMVVALDAKTLIDLSAQFAPPRKAHRTYWAVTRKPAKGKPFKKSGLISQPLGRDLRNPVKVAVRKSGKNAVTKYQVLEEYEHAFLVELVLETGRTHQIRVHLEHIGIPIFGDQLYNRGMSHFGSNFFNALLDHGIERQALHAKKLEFEHSVIKKQLNFEVDLPADMLKLIEMLKV